MQKLERMSKAKVAEYTQEAGLTSLQAKILQLRYNDHRELLVVRICDLLKISKSMYDRQHRELVRLCAAYDAEKAQN